MRILITGGCGFLGTNLASFAAATGHEVMVFDNLQRFGATKNLEWMSNEEKIKFSYGDIQIFDDVKNIVSIFRPEAVFHLAGQVAMTTSLKRPLKDFMINATGTINILEAIRACVPECRLIYASTNKIYGDLEKYKIIEEKLRYCMPEFPEGIDESFPFEPHSPYGCSKGAAEQYVIDYCRTFNLNTTVFRHSTMYGGRQFATYDQGWIGWFVSQVLAQKSKLDLQFTVSGNGKQVRDILHVQDVIELYMTALDKFNMVRGNFYNIGGGMRNSLSILELFNLLNEHIDFYPTYHCIDERLGDQKVYVSNLEKVKNDLGWIPRVSNAAGIVEMIEWASSTR